MQFEIQSGTKRLIFDSDLHGLHINGVEVLSGRDGVLMYDKTVGVESEVVELQMSTNTSALIPALRALGLSYAPYFDERPVVESQNDITFYWKPSKLAAFYNLYSTDELDYAEREPVIRQAVDFILSNSQTLPLPEELLTRMSEPSTLLGFYEGFPIFDGSTGFARLQSRLGIHVDTPLDKYEADVYELAENLEKATGLEPSKKKNRVMFLKDEKLLKTLGIYERK